MQIITKLNTKSLIGFTNKLNVIYPEFKILHSLHTIPSPHIKLDNIQKLGGLINQLYNNEENKAPRLDFADFQFNQFQEWLDLTLIIGCLDVQEGILQIDILDQLLNSFYQQYALRQFICQIQEKGIDNDFALNLIQYKKENDANQLIFQNKKGKLHCNELIEKHHRIAYLNQDDELIYFENTITKEELAKLKQIIGRIYISELK